MQTSSVFPIKVKAGKTLGGRYTAAIPLKGNSQSYMKVTISGKCSKYSKKHVLQES